MAIASELGVYRTAVDKWVAGDRYPRNARGIHELLKRLERRRPKGASSDRLPKSVLPEPRVGPPDDTAADSPDAAPLVPAGVTEVVRHPFAELQRLLNEDWRRMESEARSEDAISKDDVSEPREVSLTR